MALTLTIKQGDSTPTLRVDLNVDLDDFPITSLVFTMTDVDGNVVIDAAPAQVVSSPDGIVQYLWQTGDTDVPGIYRGEIKVNFQGGSEGRYPGDDYLWIEIVPNLDAA